WTLDYLWRIKDGEPFETDILQFVKKTTEGIYETDYYHRAKQEFQEYYKKKETK
ncbi:MAG: hypothetical protein JRD05_12995, partial [Deltaproteobacteria bacterium]|nr:hypothetical protein [Deltaproteobacteria bacterium]